MESRIIVRLSETTLKGRNRSQFEKRVAQNVAAHLKPLGVFSVRRERARLTITGDADLAASVPLLRGLPGVANLSLAEPAPAEPKALAEAVVAYTRRRLAAMTLPKDRPLTFRMEVERKDKRYPIGSMEMAGELGAAVLQALPGLKVNLTAPELTVHVELFRENALIFGEKINGPGGLAVGMSGVAVCLLSGGIDSPVAAYQMMTRGVRVVYLNFHSYPFIGEQSLEKVREIVRFLARYQPHSRLYVAPFAAIQTAIRDQCPEGLRTVLYRRMMNYVANAVARKERALALVTGESVGQVASQTLENIRAIQETAALPVFQPLIGMSKPEIIDHARRIGTYTLSIQPFPDCCTLFQPRSPDTRARLHKVQEAEARLPVETLVAECVAGLEIMEYGPEYHAASWTA